MGAVNPQEQADCRRNYYFFSSSPRFSDAVTALLSHTELIAFAVDHPDEAATLVGKYGIVPEPIAKVALPKL